MRDNPIAVYILSRALGKMGGAALGSKIMKMPSTVTKYLGLTLLPHSGVSLVFTESPSAPYLHLRGPSSAALIQGTITAAAVIKKIIAVILAKVDFPRPGNSEKPPFHKSLRIFRPYVRFERRDSSNRFASSAGLPLYGDDRLFLSENPILSLIK